MAYYEVINNPVVASWGLLLERKVYVCVNGGHAHLSETTRKGCLIMKFKVSFPGNGFLSPDKLSLLEKKPPTCEEESKKDEMEQVELVDFLY